jgi:cytoskeletal protein RodZ
MTDGQNWGWQPEQGYGPPGGPQGRKPWPARHKVLTALLGFCGLVFVIGIAAAASSSSSSTPSTTSSLIARTPAATASPTVTKPATATQTVTTAPPTTPAPPATPTQTAAAVQQTAPATPARTTSAAPPAPPASTVPASCYPLSDAGHCYEPGEFCRTSDHGASGVAGDGKAIKCEDNDGWRWEPV